MYIFVFKYKNSAIYLC